MRPGSPTPAMVLRAVVDLGAWVGVRDRSAEPARRHPRTVPAAGGSGRKQPRGYGHRCGTHTRTRPASRAYVLAHAQEMEQSVVDQHIALYVNDFTENLGPEGYAAVNALLGRAAAVGLVPPLPTLAQH